jgi:alpha-mannosidase
MRIVSIESTDLFVGTAQRPLQVVRVTLANDGPAAASARIGIQGPGVRDPGPFGTHDLDPGEERAYEVPVEVVVPYQPGSTRHVTVTAYGETAGVQAEAEIAVAEPGWTMWMVSHFHYDPVWWNTQGQFTEARLSLPDEDGELPDVRSAFELVGTHLDKARQDPDYKFVLAEIDYLKPYFDAFPQDRADLRRLLAEGRVEIVGGNYNEPSTNLIGAEAIIRNAVYGIGFQRDVFGGDPRSAWMLDVFGHDPGYPGLMAAAGLTSSAWARGPFHQWGPSGAEGGDRQMQFGTEFEWISPDGAGLLTAYMAHHYGAGWRLHTLPDLEAAEREAYGQFRGLAQVATTRNVLLPVGSDHVIPARWVTDIHRDWNQRYVWPRFTTAVPREFFDAVRAEASGSGASGSGSAGGAWITPQTRDMNPVYTGKDVSYIDTKQAQRAIETAVTEAERLGTLAWLGGAPYPHAALDKAWRLLAYGAHHDAITGVESDQVYLDLLGGWREAWELGTAARRDAAARLAGQGPGLAVTVVNGLARARDGMARVTVQAGRGDIRWLEVRDEAGMLVPALAEGVRRRDDASLAEVTLTFRARDVPALGTRAYRLKAVGQPTWTAYEPGTPDYEPAAAEWLQVAGTAIENETYLVTADPARGGTVVVTDKRTGAEVLAGPGNELVIQDEYAQHPRHGEGPWHLSPKGPGLGSASVPATVRAERCPAGARLVASFTLDGLEVTQETLLWAGAERVEFRTHVDSYAGRDRLLRVRFPASVPGGLPVYQTATAVIGRSFGLVDVDSADTWYTLDNPAHQWFGLGSTARVRDRSGLVQAIGVAEVVCPLVPNDKGGLLRDLLVALAAAGVTATCSQADGSRYGAVDADSNLPDVRIAVGGPEVNPFTAEVLAAAGPGYAKALAARLASAPAVRLWVPGARDRADAFGPDADVRGAADLPVLIVAGDLAAAVSALIADLADAEVDGGEPVSDGAQPVSGPVSGPVPVPLADRSVAVLNRGTPGSVVTADGTLHMSLMRSCSAWPSGIWIDGDCRTAPDGSSFAWQHWSHTFEYALAAGAGDWRAVGFSPAAEDYNHEFLTVPTASPLPASPPPGPLAGHGIPDSGRSDAVKPGVQYVGAAGGVGLLGGMGLAVEPGSVTVSALKPRGNPLAAGRTGALAGSAAEAAVTGQAGQAGAVPAAAGGRAEVTVRLRETSGRPVTARVRMPGVSAAWLTDLLEEADGATLPVEDGTVFVDMPAFGTVTAVAVLRRGDDPPQTPPGHGGAARPPVPPWPWPVYTRYWLHGKGPAPAGNLPVAVHFSPVRAALPEPGGTAALTLTVGCGAEPAAGTVELVVPPGVTVAPDAPAQDLRYDLAPGGYAAWDLTVRAPQAAPGRYFVAARIRDDLGHLVEDTAMVAVGERRWPDPDLPPEEELELMQADYRAGAAEVDLTVLTRGLQLAPGDEGELAVRVTSGLASELHGEAQLVSPFGTWEMLGPWTQGFSAGPGADAVLRFAGRIPLTARHGQWWALVKVMYYGRVRYTEAIPVVIKAVN